MAKRKSTKPPRARVKELLAAMRAEATSGLAEVAKMAAAGNGWTEVVNRLMTIWAGMFEPCLLNGILEAEAILDNEKCPDEDIEEWLERYE